jgi:hypothetical protein
VITNGAEFTQHSCDPNAFVDHRSDGSVWLVATRAISPKEVVSFDYNTVEWDMSSPFRCLCGSAACQGLISGMLHVPEARRAQLTAAARVSPFIRAQLAAEQQ